MRIAIDYTIAMQEGSGAGAYIRRLVSALLQQEDITDHYILVRADTANSSNIVTDNRNVSAFADPFSVYARRFEQVRTRALPLPARFPLPERNSWRFPLPTSFYTGALDIYHSPDHVLPALNKRVRKIITISDLAFLEVPEYVDPTYIAYLQQVLPRSILDADAIVTDSEEKQQLLITRLQAPREKVVVQPPTIAPYFRRIIDPLLLNAARYKFNLRQPFVLTIGTQEPGKNYTGLLKAFQRIMKKNSGPAQLVIVGEPGWRAQETHKLAHELKIDKKMRFLDRVSDLELITLYSMAEVCAFPFFHANNSLVAREALACGTPVLISKGTALARQIGDATLQIDPHDTDAIAQGITHLLTNSSLREELRQKGHAAVEKHGWENLAQQIRFLYQQVYNLKVL